MNEDPTTRIRMMRDLQPNWDGYGALPTTDAALVAVRSLCPMPMTDGGARVEMNFDGFEIAIEITPEGTFGGFFLDRDATQTNV